MARKTIKQIEAERREKLQQAHTYQFLHYKLYNYDVLSLITASGYNNHYNKRKHANCFIMADTETSKGKTRAKAEPNHVVIWTISIRAMGFNWVTLWGNKPTELCEALELIKSHIKADDVTIYWHNMSYDYTFLRRFLFNAFGVPTKQLSTKPHFPILFAFENGLIFKDSLILAQRSLEKWGSDMQVEHSKAVGFWEYDKERNQDFTPDAKEAEYIEHDTLCGVECLDKLREALGKRYNNMPYTATGIPREELRKRAFEHGGKELFKRLVSSYETYCKLEKVYHGGYTHANRYFIGDILSDVVCKDFTSSYLFALLAFKYPMERFASLPDMKPEKILADENNGYIMRLTAVNLRLKNPFEAMPALQYSKADAIEGEILDNGRVISCKAVSIYINNIDLKIIYDQYEAELWHCSEVEASTLDYLPRWLTDYVYECFSDKCKLKGVDKVLYNLAKGKANSIYGMCCMHNIRIGDIEDFETGKYDKEKPQEGETLEEMKRRLYDKFVKSHNSFLLYQWGCWCTSIAMAQLFKLGECTEFDMVCNGQYKLHRWIYSDTDSIYSDRWNEEKVEAFNAECRELLLANGYGAVECEAGTFWLGEACTTPLADEYSEYTALGAKRYAGRCKEDGELHITVAGVPKVKGAKCLRDNLENFKKGFVFDGVTTGKLTHFYVYVDEIFIDENGNEVGDSIDLQPCDYVLDEAKIDEGALYEEQESEGYYEEE